MNPVVKVLRAIVKPGTCVYSYRKDFEKLWSDELFSQTSPIVVVFDGVPASEAEQNGLNLADRVTAFDWIAWLALREGTKLSVMLLDLGSHRHLGSFGVQTLPLLLPELPWVRLYKVFGRPDEGKLLDALAKFGDGQGELATLLGRDGFGLDRLLADLNVGPAPAIPLFPCATTESAKNQIRELWSQSITRAHSRHEVANLIGPLILADAMASKNDRGAIALAKELKADPLIRALCAFLHALKMLGGLRCWPEHPEGKPVFERVEHVPLFDAFERFKKVTFLLVDDQARIGYARLLSVMLTGEAGKPWDANQPTWENHDRGERVWIRAETHPDSLITMIESAAASKEEWRKLRVLGKGRFDVLLLDLRLFPDVGAEMPSNEEVNFFSRLIAICEKVEPACEWIGSALQAARGRVDGKPDTPLQWALLPLLLCEADPSIPILIFSSTHQRAIIEALSTKPNVVTSFAKPLVSGYGETTLDQVREDLSKALKHALQLHEKRAVWERFAELGNWGRSPIYKVKYKIKSKEKRELFNRNSEPRITGLDLQQRLASYFRDHLLWDRYVESLSAPYELLEAALVPQEYLDDFNKRDLTVDFGYDIGDKEDYDDREHFSIVRALQFIRHKKAHGHALHEGMKSWEKWDDKARLTAVILLFLGDFIEQIALLPIEDNDKTDFGVWDEYCLKIAWRLCLLDHVQTSREIHPKNLTADSKVPWQDVTFYTLALGCREVAHHFQVHKNSWKALQILIDSRLKDTEKLSVAQITGDPAQPLVTVQDRDGAISERQLRSLQKGVALQQGEWVVYSDDGRALGAGCMPKSLYIFNAPR